MVTAPADPDEAARGASSTVPMAREREDPTELDESGAEDDGVP